MISEIDMRDWEHVDVDKMRKCLQEVDHGSQSYEPIANLQLLLNQIELFQRKTLKQIPKLFQNYE